jgi:hypothetical protein
VQVSITAPVDGATVVVPGIVVLGTIEPKNAEVLVSGRRANVQDGVFKLPITLRARLTRINIVARARGFVSSTTQVRVTYAPNRPRSPRSRRSVAPNLGNAGGGLSAEVGNAFVAGCSNSGGSVTGCLCVWRELTKRGFDSEAQFEALAEQWRRSFMSKGVIAFPRALKDALLACRGDFGPSVGNLA